MPLILILNLIKKLIKLHADRGDKFTLEYIKNTRSALLGYLGGRITPAGVSLTKDGIPKILGPLIPYIRSDAYLVITMCLTVLYSTRALKLGGPTNTDSITQPFTGDVTNISMFMGSFWREIGYKPSTEKLPSSIKVKFESYRSKSGPNGHALKESLSDARNLPESLINSLTVLSGPRMRFLIETARTPLTMEYLSKWMTFKDKGQFRRLSSFKDKENKQRVIGILDWYSQLALKPLHVYLSNVLKKIPQDCTFDQSKFKKLLKPAKVFYSVDLSNATDRFPIQLIETLLKVQLPMAYVDAWKDTMVGYPFDYKGDRFIYRTGNPMGAYSSFNSFALTHHYLIYYLCRVNGKNWKTLPYSILGDDIVIGDELIGQRYMELLKVIGVQYSEAKTHQSERMYEFAKRIVYKGIEVSPFPISALKECGKSFNMLTILLFEQTNRNWIPIQDLWSSVGSYYGHVLNRNSTYRNKVEVLSRNCLGVLKLVHGIDPANLFLNELIARNKYRLPVLSEEVSKNILINTIVDAFAESNILKSAFNDIYDYPLTKMCSSIMNEWPAYLKTRHDIDLTSKSNRAVHPRNFPILLAQKAVSQEFEELQQDLIRRDKEGLDWTYQLRTFALPRTDKSILDKGSYTLSKSVKHFFEKLDYQLQVLEQYPQLLN